MNELSKTDFLGIPVGFAELSDENQFRDPLRTDLDLHQTDLSATA
jgi:hypothetical protein